MVRLNRNYFCKISNRSLQKGQSALSVRIWWNEGNSFASTATTGNRPISTSTSSTDFSRPFSRIKPLSTPRAPQKPGQGAFESSAATGGVVGSAPQGEGGARRRKCLSAIQQTAGFYDVFLSTMTGKMHSAPGASSDAVRGDAADDSAPVILHPLVVINVSDHFTRFAAMRMFPSVEGAPSSDPGASVKVLTDANGGTRVMGILLGTQSGRTVEVCHSFELSATSLNGRTVVDSDFMQRRIQQYRQIFSQYNVVGWYCTGTEVSSEDLRLHTEVFSVLNEAPILLVVNPNHNASDNAGNKAAASRSSVGDGKLAHSAGVLSTYQMELRVVNDIPKKILAPVPHRYASEDSERIAVDHVMRHAVPGGGDGTSSTALHLLTLRRSIKMLKSRVELLVAFLEATAAGKIEVDHGLLRKVAGVCARLPAMDCKEFSEAFADERNDSLVVTYLTGITKSLCSMNDAVDMFNRLTERSSTGGASRRRAVFTRG